MKQGGILLNIELAKTKKELAEKERLYKEALDQIELLKGELSSSNRSSLEFSDKTKELQDTNEKLADDVTSLKNTNSVLDQNNKGLVEIISGLREAGDELLKRTMELNIENAELKEQLERLSYLKDLEEMKPLKEKELNSLVEEIARLNLKVSRLRIKAGE